MTIEGYYRIYLDNAAIGCGWRHLIVFDVGHKLAHVCEPVTGAVATILKTELRNAKPIARPRWARIRRQLKIVRRNARVHGWRVADKTIKRLAEATREVTAA